jgi:hypothetical protein
MPLTTPPGYQSLVPLDRTRHRNLGVRANAASFAATLQVVYLSVAEFITAARDYPLVFAADAAGAWHPCAVLGLEPGQNLWIDEQGAWLPDAYCPAYVRCYPFHTARLPTAQGTQSVVGVDERGLDDSLPHLFDSRGEATPRWREIERFIEEVETARVHTVEFCRRLTELDLLEEFEADINPTLGQRQRLIGMRRVAEKRLQALPDAQVKALMLNGTLARIYAHLMSLDNFHRLLQMDAARRRGGSAIF